jgi:hypothetical protein
METGAAMSRAAAAVARAGAKLINMSFGEPAAVANQAGFVLVVRFLQALGGGVRFGGGAGGCGESGALCLRVIRRPWGLTGRVWGGGGWQGGFAGAKLINMAFGEPAAVANQAGGLRFWGAGGLDLRAFGGAT